MNYISYILYFMAGVLAAAAAILFVAFDIRYIWKVLRGNSVYRTKQGNDRTNAILDKVSDPAAATEKLNRQQRNLQANGNEDFIKGYHKRLETLPLQKQDSTVLLEDNTVLLQGTTVLLESSANVLENRAIPNEYVSDSLENSTILLQSASDLLETKSFHLIQNIVYIDSEAAILL